MFTNDREPAAGTVGDRGYGIPEIIVWHGDKPEAVMADLREDVRRAEHAPDGSGFLKRLAYDTQQRFAQSRGQARARAALTAYTENEFRKKAAQMLHMISSAPDAAFSYPAAGIFYGMGSSLGKLAFLFPGQGSQYPGMGGPLAGAYAAARRVWDTLGQMRFSGRTIEEMVFPEAVADEGYAKKAFLRLSSADWTNPCISVAGEAILVLLEQMGVSPDAVAAHSFGDINALRGAGVLSPEQMIRLTRYRGELGVSCPLATRGCILAVPETAEKTRSILASHNIGDVWIANYNTREQTVLSGVKASVHKAHQAFTDEGIKTRMIPISAAPHCPLAVDVAEKFHESLADVEFRQAECDVYSFLFGRRIKNDPVFFRKLLKTHIEKPVRFLSQIEQMHHDGIRIFVEIGPANILTVLTSQILAEKRHIALHTDHKKEDPVLVFLNAAAELFKQGRVRDFSVLWEGCGPPARQGPTVPAGLTDAPGPDMGTQKRLKKLDMEIARIESVRSGRAQTA